METRRWKNMRSATHGAVSCERKGVELFGGEEPAARPRAYLVGLPTQSTLCFVCSNLVGLVRAQCISVL